MQTWAWVQEDTVPAGWKVVAAADFTNTPHLWWQNDATRQVTMWYLTGPGGSVLDHWNYLSTLGWTIVAAGDFNADSKPDLLWQNDETQELQVSYMEEDGGTVFQGWTTLSTSLAGWTVVAAVDMNLDGKIDLVTRNNTTGQVRIWYFGGPGGNVFQSFADVAMTGLSGWTVVTAADTNGDGTPDLVWQNDADRTLRITYMTGANGSTVLNTVAVSVDPLPAGWTVVAAGYFDADSNPDLLLEDSSSGVATVWYMGPGGTTRLSWDFLSPDQTTLGWLIAGVADFNVDGRADVVWQKK